MPIREANSADAPLLAGLGAHVQDLHHKARPDWFRPADAGAAVPVYEALLADPAVTAFVLEDEGEAIGYVVARVMRWPETPLTWAATVVDIDQIGVVPDARRRGIGAQLVRAVRQLADEVGATRIHLTVWDFNQAAQEFFAAAGLRRAMWRMTDP